MNKVVIFFHHRVIKCVWRSLKDVVRFFEPKCVCCRPSQFCPEKHSQTGYCLLGWRRRPWCSDCDPQTLECTATFASSPTAWSTCHLIQRRKKRKWLWGYTSTTVNLPHRNILRWCWLTTRSEDVGLRGVDGDAADVVLVGLKHVNSGQCVIIIYTDHHVVLVERQEEWQASSTPDYKIHPDQ